MKNEKQRGVEIYDCRKIYPPSIWYMTILVGVLLLALGVLIEKGLSPDFRRIEGASFSALGVFGIWLGFDSLAKIKRDGEPLD
jgi:hypothetical protein